MAVANQFIQPIEVVLGKLRRIVSDVISQGKLSLGEANLSVFSPYKMDIEQALKTSELHYDIDMTELNYRENLENSIKEEILKFNEGLNGDSNEVIKHMAFQRLIHTQLSKVTESRPEITDSDYSIGEYKVTSLEFEFFQSLFVIFDLQVFLMAEGDIRLKNSFYSNIITVSKNLAAKSIYTVDKFWYYLDSRFQLIKAKVFDRTSVSDRISILELCNTLTDRFFVKNSQGKRDSYKKDTFSDVFQYKIRFFTASLLSFEDNTGLNKYFFTSNRMVKEIVPTSRYKSDREFVKDIISIKRMFNDPYTYLKSPNHKVLTKTSETMFKVYKRLLDDEISDAAVNPKADQFVIMKLRSESELKDLERLYSKRNFFPESYWLTPFEDTRKDPHYEKHLSDDLDFAESQLEISKFRQCLLLQIYILVNLYYELSNPNRKDFLKSLGVSTNVKHLTDDSPPDSLVSLFFKIKREMQRALKSIDIQLSFLLQHLSLTEVMWYGWLINGKNPANGKPFFQDMMLSGEQLDALDKKRDEILPLKRKRYFNLYATPQLSRKMKVETGLSKLNNGIQNRRTAFDRNIDELSQRLDDSKGQETINDLVEQRNVNIWKKLRTSRESNWLDFVKSLDKDKLQYAPPSSVMNFDLEAEDNNSMKRSLDIDSPDLAELHAAKKAKV